MATIDSDRMDPTPAEIVVAVRRTSEPHHYRVFLNGEPIGHVWRVRFPNSSFTTGRQSNRSGYGEGHWGWCADTAPESEYPTRREAVEDMREISEAEANRIDKRFQTANNPMPSTDG